MGDSQCGLCLSCGGPFLPEVDDIDFFNRQGNLSILFLNTEFKNSADIRRLYDKAQLVGKRHQAHMFHQSHHATAVNYMCNMHRDDGDVGHGVVPARNAPVPNQVNAPLLYFHSPTSKGDKGGEAAFWTRPARADRLDMSSLLKVIVSASREPTAMVVEQNLELTHLTCDKCNIIMTQLADFRFLLGYNAAGSKNTRGRIIRGTPIRQYKMRATTPLPDAFGNWEFLAPPANVVQRPTFTDTDSEAPYVAYYLHMCLPFREDGVAHDVFHRRIRVPALRASARTLYVEQCWLILEIACLALAVEEGKVATGTGKLSFGMHQHLGALDLYVSFFVWRLIQFQYGQRLSAVMDFVQWHQKFYCDALDCKALFRLNQRQDVLARSVYGTTDQSARTLVETICVGLIRLYKWKLNPLVRLVARLDGVPPEVKDYFVPWDTLRALKLRSVQVRALSFFVVRHFIS